MNNLAAKLMLALLPPNAPFFKLAVDDFTLEKLTQQQGMRGEVEKALNKVERAVQTEIETSAIRVSASEALKQLINSGNVLCYLPPSGGMKVFRLDRYVVQRDPMGNVLEIVTKEDVAVSALPLKVLQAVKGKIKASTGDDQKTLELYTHVKRETKNWVVYQELSDVIVPDSQGTYPLDKSPWIPLRWTNIDGEDYGRGYVEEYLGDLKSLEGLSKAIVEGSAAAAKILILVNPNGTTNLKTITDAPNGAVRAGNKDDVTVLQMDKFADFRVALETTTRIEQRVSMAFLLNSSVQRNGERVTAEEIRYMAGELEDALGGVYSILSQEFQLPLVQRLMFQMQQQKKLPVLPHDLVKPAITTGLEALGRGHDVNKLDMLIQGIAQTFGPQAISQAVNIGEYINRRGTALGIDMAGLIKSAEQQAAEAQQAQMQMIFDKLGPKGMDILRDQLKPGQTDAPQTPDQGGG